MVNDDVVVECCDKPPKKQAGRISQAIITIEAIVYSIGLFILLSPVYIGKYIYMGLKWLASVIPSIVIRLLSALAKVIIAIFNVIIKSVFGSIYVIIHTLIVLVIDFIITCIRYIWSGICEIYRILYNYWGKINWCAVRSSIRIFAIICIIGSIYAIIEGILSIPPGTVVLTGKFFDPNGTVFRVHEAIALLMISITAFYNAWAYSKDEEVSFICTHTVGVKTLRKISDKVWNK